MDLGESCCVAVAPKSKHVRPEERPAWETQEAREVYEVWEAQKVARFTKLLPCTTKAANGRQGEGDPSGAKSRFQAPGCSLCALPPCWGGLLTDAHGLWHTLLL